MAKASKTKKKSAPAKKASAAKAKAPAKKAAPKTKAKAKTAKAAPKTKSAKTIEKTSAKAPSKKTNGATVISMDKARNRKSSAKDSSSAFTPLDDRVLVRRAGVADRTPGGIFIPDTVSSSERPSQGQVVAVGRGHRDKKGRIRPLDVQNGDTVMYSTYAGSEVSIGGEDLLLLREEEILAIVKD